MAPVLAILAVWFGGDVAALGGREWRVREAAERRLAAAGWVAAPALHRGLGCDSLEAAERCQRLLNGLPRLDAALARVVLDADPREPLPAAEALLPLGPALCREIDRRGGSDSDLRSVRDSWQWVQQQPYRCGSEAGDLAFVVAQYRGQFRFLW